LANDQRGTRGRDHVTTRRIVVIGAGIAGLAAAFRLQQAGANVLVLEGTDQPGGRMTTDTVGLRDRAPGVYPRSLRCRRGPIPSPSCTLGARSSFIP